MRLERVSYVEFKGQPQEWRLDDLILGPVNLLVGKNASGKSRSISLVDNLARLLSGARKPDLLSGEYEIDLSHQAGTIQYRVAYAGSKVEREEVLVDGEQRLIRGEGGVGQIFSEKDGKLVDFQAPDSELAAVVRRDSVQHSFLQPLYEWGSSVYCYLFGTSLGRDVIGFLPPEDRPSDLNPREPNQVLAIFRRGIQSFGDRFKSAIMVDMGSMGYGIDDVGLAPPTSMLVQGSFPAPLLFLYVKEGDLLSATDQNAMSQGMFRALSIIIQINYATLALTPSCVLIDDVGEGLDFERSCALIKLLMQKAEASQMQLVMATNDRFVMNMVPLDVWTVLQREGGHCRAYSRRNAKELFDEFKFTGLSNFDFLASDYLNRARQSQ